jgi:ubiquinone/menaquinone biosynthesis C-methylase UbiE
LRVAEVVGRTTTSGHEHGPRPQGDAQSFWIQNQPGFRFTDHPPGSVAFFAEVERHRYALEPATREMADFARWRGHDVLEAGCGIATDGINFARAGARYVGVDLSTSALELAEKRFDTEGQRGHFVIGSATELPFADDSFDLVYSCGVIHHVADTRAAVREFHRVLRPGGHAIVMVYHRDSLNHRVSIMIVRRALVGALLFPGVTRVMSRATGEDVSLLEAHKMLLRDHGIGYLTNRELFLSHNTDGPGNPLSKVYASSDARELFSDFADVGVQARFLNLRVYPLGERLAATNLAQRLERRIGWHLWIHARKTMSE